MGLKDKAIQYFDKTIEKCKNILQNHEIPQVYVLYADSISQNCALKPKSYAISQGPKIKTMAKKALDLDPTYGTAYFLTNTQNIFTPPPFGNLEEGMKALIPLLDKNIYRMDKADYYNAFTARGFGYLEKGDKEQAEYWAFCAAVASASPCTSLVSSYARTSFASLTRAVPIQGSIALISSRGNTKSCQN